MNIADLQANLDGVRAWRKVELSYARGLAERQRGSAEEGYLCRAWVMMIYAHCDQALKLIAQQYIEFLKENPRGSYDYRTVWIAFFGKEALRNTSDSRFLLCSKNDDGSRAIQLNNIKGNEVFKSGNFSYPLLRFFVEWVIQANFVHQDYKGFCETLKEKRDGIAHGEEIRIQSVDDCLSWHGPAISLLDTLVEATMDTALTHLR